MQHSSTAPQDPASKVTIKLNQHVSNKNLTIITSTKGGFITELLHKNALALAR